jgi:hypothetical protein
MVSLYAKPSLLRDWLTQYKGRPDGSEPLIPEYIDVVKALAARFFYERGDEMMSRSPFDVIAVVPSASRPPPHPFEALLQDLPLQVPIVTLLHRGSGELGHNRPSRDGYVAVDAKPQRVLLVDDVETTGARINSAGYALTQAGHTIAGAFVVARRITPSWRDTQPFWDQQVARGFTWDNGPLVNAKQP